MNTWVSFQSAEQPLPSRFSVSGNSLTLRTRIGLPSHLAVIPGPPTVPTLGYVLYHGAEDLTAATRQLAALIQTSLEEQAFSVTDANQLKSRAT